MMLMIIVLSRFEGRNVTDEANEAFGRLDKALEGSIGIGQRKIEVRGYSILSVEHKCTVNSLFYFVFGKKCTVNSYWLETIE